MRISTIQWSLVAWLASAAGLFAQTDISDATAAIKDRMSLQEIVSTGGWPMYVLGVMSVFGVALVFYYFVVLRHNQVLPRKLTRSLRRLLSSGELDQARSECEKNRSAISAISLSALDYATGVEDPDPLLLKEIIEGEGNRQATMIQNQIQYLQDIAVIAPMIGLLGTVMGMLTAFNSVALDIAKAKPMVLAAGVSQALVTTAAGLIVGIPAMMAYAYFRGRAAHLLASLEAASAELLTLLVRKS